MTLYGRLTKSILSVLVYLAISTPAVGQSLPKQCKVWLPDYIANTNKFFPDWDKSLEWQDWAITKIKSNDFGKASTLVWSVYSDRTNNKTYTEPNSSSTIHSTLGFMEQLNVADIQNGFALLYKTLGPNEALKMPKDAQCFGWIPVDNLLLWGECPKTYTKIYQKALVVHTPSKSVSAASKNPTIYIDPGTKTEANQKATDLEILFVMKAIRIDETKYYLLSQGTNLSNSVKTIYGWVPEQYITEWNQRLLVEPTYNSKEVGHYKSKSIYPTIFYEMDDARQLWTNEIIQNPLWIYGDFGTKRMHEQEIRFPILAEVSADIFRVVSVTTLKSEVDAAFTTKLEETIEKFKTEQDAHNIEIVIATKKEPYLQQQKLTSVLRSFAWSEKDINTYITHLRNGGVAKFIGYAPIKTSKSQFQLFNFVLFFSQNELEEIITQLSHISWWDTDTESNAKVLQDAIVNMGQIMLNQLNEDEIRNMDMDKLLGKIYGIPIPLNLCGLDIKKIPNMGNEALHDYCRIFNNKLYNLKQIISDANYNGRFQINHNNYYWIPMDNMPGVYEDCSKLKIQ